MQACIDVDVARLWTTQTVTLHKDASPKDVKSITVLSCFATEY